MRTMAVLCSLWVLGCASHTGPRSNVPQGSPAAARSEVDQLLDGFHASAARADETAYFAAFTPDAVFLGTDASERWSVEAFRAYTHPHFAAGHGYTYTPHDRHVAFAADGTTAWFDEQLTHPTYGELRGTGVVVKQAGSWKVAHYNMTFTIPNDIAKQVVELVKSTQQPRP